MKALKWISENSWIHLLVSLILVITSGQEVLADVMGDLTAMRMGSHHGVFILGLFHLLKTLPDILGNLREVQGNAEKVKGK